MTNWELLRLHAAAEKYNPEGLDSYRVVGVTFTPNYPGNILALENLMRDLDTIPLTLVRNPHNKYDNNAVEVRYAHEMLGHLSKEVAARVAPKLDAGNEYSARVDRVLINPDKPELPGLDIIVEWTN